MDRVKTGIAGLDELMNGGIPQGSTVVVSGGTGTGKTIFGMQYIYNGAKDFKEPGIFVSLETNLKNIVWNMTSFKWDIKKMQDAKLMKTYRLNLHEPDNEEMVGRKLKEELEVILKMVKELKAKRLVIDSITAIGIWVEKKSTLRSLLYEFTDKLKELNCTTLLTTETSSQKEDLSAFGVEEFVSDGVIALYFSPPNRSLFVRKMRGTNHSRNIHPLEIGEKGLSVKPQDRVMWESIK